MMKRSLPGMYKHLTLSLAVVVLAGCAYAKPVNYDDLPGSNRMEKGPGLFAPDNNKAYQDGYTVYSTDKNKPANTTTHAQGEAHSAPTASAPGNASPTTTPSPSDYQDYKAFQAWQRFKQLPKTAPEYQQFQQWLKWQRFKEWQKKQ